MFDDLIPENNSNSGMFDDLIPSGNNPKREQAKKEVRETQEFASQYLPGALLKSVLPESITKYSGLDAIGPVIDKAIGSYHSYAMGAAQGIPVAGAYLDEAAAGIASLTGENYDEALNRARAIFEVAQENNPKLNVAGQLVSGVGTGFGIAGPVVKASQTALGAIGRGAAINAGIGAAHGTGLGEDLQDRVEKTKDGALIGGAFGAAIPTAATIAGPLIKKGAETFGRSFDEIAKGSDEAAIGILAKNIKKSGDTVDSIGDDLAKGQNYSRRFAANSYADLNETIADTTGPLRALAGSVKRAGGEASEIVSDVVQKRQIGPSNPLAKVPDTTFKGQMREVIDAFDRALNIKTSKTSRSTKDFLLSKQKTEGHNLYTKAYKESEPFDLAPALRETLDEAEIYSGKINKSLVKAVKLFVRGKKGKESPVNDIMRFDASKKELDDMIGRARGNQKRELVIFKDKLLNEVHGPDMSKNLTYKKARDSWGSSAENKEAIELGEKALQSDSQDVIETFKSLTPGQKKLFLIGMRDSLRKSFAKKRPGNDATLIFQENRAREILEIAIPQTRGKGVFNDRAERFGDYINRQSRMNQTRNKVLGGSPTAERLSQDAELAADTITTGFQRFRTSGTLTAAAFEAVGSLAHKFFGMRQETAVKLAKMLMETSPEKQVLILQEVRRKYGSQAVAQFIKGVDEASLALGIAGTATYLD